MAAQVLRRVQKLPFDDDRRKSFLEITINDFATHLLTGLPEPGALFKPSLWREQVSVYMSLCPPETSKHAGRPIIIKGTRRGILDSHGHSLLNNKYATAGGISRNHNSSLRLVENGLKEAGIPYKATGFSNGAGTKGTIKRKLPPILDENSTKNIKQNNPRSFVDSHSSQREQRC